MEQKKAVWTIQSMPHNAERWMFKGAMPMWKVDEISDKEEYAARLNATEGLDTSALPELIEAVTEVISNLKQYNIPAQARYLQSAIDKLTKQVQS